MTDIIHPIADEMLADRAIELFLAGYSPDLYAWELGCTPEQVWDQIRVTLRIHVEKALAAQQKLSRKGTGRPPLFGKAMTNAERLRRSREKRKNKA